MKKIETLFIPILFVAIAAAARLIDHAPNFTPLGAMALFSSVYLFSTTWKSRVASTIIPIAALFISDIFIGFYKPELMLAVYGSFILNIVIGWFIRGGKKITVPRVGLGSIAGSIQFFLITNFAVWLFQDGKAYPKNAGGLLEAYVQGLPFFRNTLTGDLIYTAAIFGAYVIATSIVTSIMQKNSAKNNVNE